MCRLMTVDEAKEVCRDRSVLRSVPSNYHARDKVVKLVYFFFVLIYI